MRIRVLFIIVLTLLAEAGVVVIFLGETDPENKLCLVILSGLLGAILYLAIRVFMRLSKVSQSSLF